MLAPLGDPAANERERVRRVLSEIARRVNARLGDEAALAIGVGGAPSGAGRLRPRLPGGPATRCVSARPSGSSRRSISPAMGFYRLLFPLHRDDELVAFRDEVLGPLLAYDRRRNSEMIDTLEAYFDSGCNVVDAADRLHVHRNSLAYRLRRVAEITGRDLHQQEHLFLLQLALKVHRVLQAVAVEVHHHEVGTAGQCEIDMRFDSLTQDGRQPDALQVRRPQRRPQARQGRDLHAEADLRRQRLRHARPPVDLEGRQADSSATPTATPG